MRSSRTPTRSRPGRAAAPTSRSRPAGAAAPRTPSPTATAGSGFPTITSISGASTFCIGLKRPLAIGTGSLTSVLVLNGFNSTPEAVAREKLDGLPPHDRQHGHDDRRHERTTQQAIDISAAFSVDPTINTVFPQHGLGNQLKQVAKVIKLNQTSPSVNLQRQIFFVSQGGYDTHQDQLNDQGNNFLDLSQALNAFYNATVELGLQDKVTTFTLSDFGRTLEPSGAGGGRSARTTAGAATSSSWATASSGGNFYGTPNGSTGLIFPVAHPRRAGRHDEQHQQRPRPLDPDDGVGPVRRHAREVVRRARHRHGLGVPEQGQLLRQRPRLHGYPSGGLLKHIRTGGGPWPPPFSCTR